MNIIIPLAGLGKRFQVDGYSLPKPLIKVFGEPLIFHVLKSLKTRLEDKIYIVYHPDLDKHGFNAIIQKEFPEITLIKLNYPTRGAAETVLCGLQKVTDIKDPTLICDGDTFYQDDIIGQAHWRPIENAIFYFEDKNEAAIYSYVRISENKVTSIKEKEKISDNACTGAYLFKSGELLKLYCEQILQTEQSTNGEYYMSVIYNEMLKTNEAINALFVENFQCLGTPNQLKAYCMGNSEVSTNKNKAVGYKRFCFDLDGTLCTFPINGHYHTIKPIEKNIKKLKHLHSLGHTIIIQTARGMGSNSGNAGAALANRQKDVFEFLQKHEIPYEEIYFGKPQANFYIDDLAVSAYSDLDKELGFYDGKVEPRHFNNVVFDGEYVHKKTNNPGELYWYENIPESIKIHFPELTKDIYPDKNRFIIDKINGVPLSYLFVNGSLTKADIDLLFETMDKIHNSEFTPGNIDLYGNYASKVTSRCNAMDKMDLHLFLDEATFIKDKLIKYEKDDLGIKGVIHGDPVLTNIFLCEPRTLKFIDMRGMIGEEKTIFGDIIYDYAKIYQSLCGYDLILTDTEPNEAYQKELKNHFELKFIEKFPKHFDWLKLITASHFLTLVPLHTDYNKQVKYLDLMKKLIQ